MANYTYEFSNVISGKYLGESRGPTPAAALATLRRKDDIRDDRTEIAIVKKGKKPVTYRLIRNKWQPVPRGRLA